MEGNIDSYKIIDGVKIMWDRYTYEDRSKAEEVEEEYKKNGFETLIIEEDGQFLVYTRREVTEIILDDGGGL